MGARQAGHRLARPGRSPALVGSGTSVPWGVAQRGHTRPAGRGPLCRDPSAVPREAWPFLRAELALRGCSGPPSMPGFFPQTAAWDRVPVQLQNRAEAAGADVAKAQASWTRAPLMRPPPWPPLGSSGEHSGHMLPPAPPRAGRHPALEPKGCLGRRALWRQAESPSSRAERSSPRQPSLGPSACLAWPAWPPACLLQRSASPPLPPPQLCGYLCPGPGLQQLRPAAQPAHERRGRLPGHHPGKCVLAKQGPARLLRPSPWARPTQGGALSGPAWQPCLRTGSG